MTKPPTVETAKIRWREQRRAGPAARARGARRPRRAAAARAPPIARGQHLRRVPRVGRAAPRQGEQQAADGHAEHHRAGDVDAVLAYRAAGASCAATTTSASPPERQVDEEDPAPRDGVGQRAAEQRPGHRGDPPHRADEALVAAALAGREEVGDRRLGERQQAAGAEALQRPAGHELAHRLRRPAQQRADQEDRDGDDEQPPAPVEVRQLAVQRDGDRRGEQVRGDDPRELLEAAAGR